MNRFKKIFKYALMMGTIAAFTTACDNDDTPSGGALKDVKFDNAPKGEISAVPTGTTQNVDGQTLKEYDVTVEKSDVFQTAELINNGGVPLIEAARIYPGSILRGSSFIQGAYDPLVLTNDFNPVTVYITGLTTGTQIYQDNVSLTGSGVAQAMNDILSNIKSGSNITKSEIPTNYQLKIDTFSNGESFTKTVKIHAKANILGLVKANFGYDYSSSTYKNHSYQLLKFTQRFYSIAIDPKNAAHWVNGGLTVAECGEYEPLYISSVDYGRAAYMLIESDISTAKTQEYISTSLKAAFGLSLGMISGSVTYNHDSKLYEWFNTGKVRVVVIGGSAGNTVITDYDSFIDFLNVPSTNKPSQTLNSAAPISYTVRRLQDNTQVDLVNYYQEVYKAYRK
jgi:thiol-activated cytolysin